jgi:DNA-binding MarR family transcriptional regulator
MSVLAKRRLRAWIRLLAVTRRTESVLRDLLRGHDTTLPRFDVMAALQRRPEGVTMSELSRMLLVSNGNATAVVDRLEAEGLVRRTPSESDRRTVFVALTPEGLSRFQTLAAEHEAHIDRIFGGLSESDLDTLTTLLKRMGSRDDFDARLDGKLAATPFPVGVERSRRHDPAR